MLPHRIHNSRRGPPRLSRSRGTISSDSAPCREALRCFFQQPSSSLVRPILQACHQHLSLLPTALVTRIIPIPQPQVQRGPPRKVLSPASPAAGAKSNVVASSPSVVDVWQEMMLVSTNCESRPLVHPSWPFMTLRPCLPSPRFLQAPRQASLPTAVPSGYARRAVKAEKHWAPSQFTRPTPS